jgi:hypothetical protein
MTKHILSLLIKKSPRKYLLGVGVVVLHELVVLHLVLDEHLLEHVASGGPVGVVILGPEPVVVRQEVVDFALTVRVDVDRVVLEEFLPLLDLHPLRVRILGVDDLRLTAVRR